MSSEAAQVNAELGALLSTEYRPAFSCDDCRAIWYGVREPIADRGNQPVGEYCPHCAGSNVSGANLPGALLLNPGVEWPGDSPWSDSSE